MSMCSMDIVGERDFAGDRVFGVVIALDIKHRDPGGPQSFKLPHQKGRGFRAALCSIVKVTSDQEGRNALGERRIDDPDKSGPCRGLDVCAQGFIAKRQGCQRRVEVNVSGVQYLDQTYSPINRCKRLPAISAQRLPSAKSLRGAARIDRQP